MVSVKVSVDAFVGHTPRLTAWGTSVSRPGRIASHPHRRAGVYVFSSVNLSFRVAAIVIVLSFSCDPSGARRVRRI